MNDPDTTSHTTASDTAPAASSPAPSQGSTSTPASPSGAPSSGPDRPAGPGIPGSMSKGRPTLAKPAAPLTTPTPEKNPNPAQPPGLSLEEVQKTLNIKSAEDLKRFQNREQLFGRQTNELGQMRQRLAQFEKAKTDALKAAENQKLKIWSSKHPEHSKWNSLHSKVQENNKRVGELTAMAKGLPPEQAEAWIQEQTARIRGELAPEDTDQWNAFVDHKKSEDMRWHTDREGVLREEFDRMFEDRMQQREMESQAKADVQKDLESPELKQFLDTPENKEQFDTALDGMAKDPWTYATHLVRMKQQNDALFARLKDLESQNGEVSQRLQLTQTQAQLDARKAKAAITRDVKPVKGNAYALAREEAQKSGISTTPTNPAWRRLLEKHMAAVNPKG